MASFSSSYVIPDRMEEIIRLHITGNGAVGLVGGIAGPGADLPMIAMSWVGMTITLAEEAGHTMDNQTAKKICLAVATGTSSMITGSKIFAAAAGWIGSVFTGGASLAVASASNAALNAYFTRTYGRACARYFLQTDEIDTANEMVRIMISLMHASSKISAVDAGVMNYINETGDYCHRRTDRR